MCLVSTWVPGDSHYPEVTSATEAAPQADGISNVVAVVYVLFCCRADPAQGLTNKCQVGALIYTHALDLFFERMLFLPFPTSPM